MIVIVLVLWPVRHIIACFCHEVIHSACFLIDDRDCESVMASEAYNCLFCHDFCHNYSDNDDNSLVPWLA